MKIITLPLVEDGTPCVVLQVGDAKAQMTSRQAEELAESLGRAATAARYESAIAAALAEFGGDKKEQDRGIARVRQLIESRRAQQN